MKITFPLLLISVIFLLGCGKETDTVDNSKIKNLLTSKPWHLINFYSNGFDEFGGWSICQKDDIYNFYTNGILEHTTGLIVCSNQTNPLSTFSWDISTDGKKLIIISNGFQSEQEITVNDTTLTLITYQTNLTTKQVYSNK